MDLKLPLLVRSKTVQRDEELFLNHSLGPSAHIALRKMEAETTRPTLKSDFPEVPPLVKAQALQEFESLSSLPEIHPIVKRLVPEAPIVESRALQNLDLLAEIRSKLRPKFQKGSIVNALRHGLELPKGSYLTRCVPKQPAQASSTGKSWNWTPAPEESKPDELGGSADGDGNKSEFFGGPLEDIYGVLAYIDLDSDDRKSITTQDKKAVGGPRPPMPMPIWEQRAVAFQRNQLTPPSFLFDEKWKDLRPGNFQLVACFSTQIQMTFDNAYFYIEPRRGVTPYEPEFFLVQVISPSGFQHFVHVSRDPVNTNRLQCVFYPEEPGTHFARASLGLRGMHSIDGSPLAMDICRNYALAGSRTTLIKNLATDSPDENELEAPYNCRIGGITMTHYANAIYATDVNGGQILKFIMVGDKLLLSSTFDLEKVRFGSAVCQPTAIAYDRATELLVLADTVNHRICKFTLDGKFIMSFGREGLKDGELKFPCGVAVSNGGSEVAIMDSSNHRIQVFSNAGVLIAARTIYVGRTKVKPNSVALSSGVVFNRTGDKLFLSDTNCEVVYVLNSDLTFHMCIDHGAFGTSCTPVGLALDDVGNLLVCDPGSNVVRVFNYNGVLIHTTFATGLNSMEGPEYILTLSSGLCCVVDKAGTQLRIF